MQHPSSSLRRKVLSAPFVCALLASAGLAGCEQQEVADGADGGGGTAGTEGGVGGTSGSAGASGASGSAGSGGAGPCDGVPTTGMCVGTASIRTCMVTHDGETSTSQVIEVACDPTLEKCDATGGVARCVPVGDCAEGVVECKDSATLRTCTGGAWVETACGADSCEAKTGYGAGCVSFAPGSGLRVQGRFLYEKHVPNSATNPTGYSATPVAEGGGNFLVTIYEGSELIGIDLTSPGGSTAVGTFDVEVSQAPTATTYVYFWPVAWSDQGKPLIAVARAKSPDPILQEADEYWWWGYEVCPGGQGCGTSTIDVGDLTVTVGDGSGAANIYHWFQYDYFRMRAMPKWNEVDPPLSTLVLWQGYVDSAQPGIKFSCGSCFLPPSLGGGTVKVGATATENDRYDTSMCVAGRGSGVVGQWDYESHWSRSTMNHEIGHWSMSSWSTSPGEGGPHYVDSASLPGLAYSEAWATFSGQTNISVGPGDNDPIYFTVQNGSGFWVDISKAQWSGGPLDRPNPNGPVDQDVNENIVSSVMWSLWASSNALTPQGLGDGPMFEVMRSPRLNGSVNRGYSRLDLIDYLDALSCENLATNSQIQAAVDEVGFPWKAADVVCN